MAETITQTVNDYLYAVTIGDASLLRDVFDPRACIVGTYEGATEWLPLEDFIDQVRSFEQPFGNPEPAFEILGIDKSGNAASVKLETSFAGVVYCEYLSLLERDNNWSIVHRLYHIKD